MSFKALVCLLMVDVASSYQVLRSTARPPTPVLAKNVTAMPKRTPALRTNIENYDIQIENKVVRKDPLTVMGRQKFSAFRTPPSHNAWAQNAQSFYVGAARLTDEQRLMHKLFSEYDRYARPVLNMSHPIVISMSLTITQIFELDEKNQVLITNAWANFEWRDEYLNWNPSEFADMEMVRMTSYRLWTPDIVLYNNAADFSPTQISTRAMVSADGLIFWSVPNKFFSSCKIDVTYFPFDEQICRMKFGSWTYDGFKLDLVNSSVTADLSMYVKSGEWDLISAEQRRNVVVYTCCIEPYPDVTFYIHIRRKALYYFLNVFMPCFLMSALTLLVFLLPVESGEKCGLGVTIMLSFAVFMLTVIEKLPDTSESFPLVSIYLTVVLTMTAISICCTVAVLSLSHQSTREARVPHRMRKFLNVIAPLCCVHQSRDWMKKAMPVVTKMSPAEFLAELSRELECLTLQRVEEVTKDPERFRDTFVAGVNRILDRHQGDAAAEMIKSDWRCLAQYIDRTLFWLLFIFIICFTVWLLIFYAPEHQLRLNDGSMDGNPFENDAVF